MHLFLHTIILIRQPLVIKQYKTLQVYHIKILPSIRLYQGKGEQLESARKVRVRFAALIHFVRLRIHHNDKAHLILNI